MELKTLYKPLAISPEPILNLDECHQLYQVVAVAARLRLFEELAEGQPVKTLARRRKLDETVLGLLLDVLYHLGYLEKDDDCYLNSAIAEGFLRSGELLYCGHRFSESLPPDSLGQELLQCLEGASGHQKRPEPDWTPERLRQIGVAGLGGSIQATVSAVKLAAARRFLDLGGGHGFYSIALAQKYPALSVTLFDLPQVVAQAEEYVRTFEMTERIELVSGNFLKCDIGSGYDAVLCANILHGEKRSIVLEKVRRSLTVGGSIIVKCRISDCPETLANAQAKLIWQVRGGQELYSTDEWRQLLNDYGFKDIQVLNVHGIFATLMGVK